MTDVEVVCDVQQGACRCVHPPRHDGVHGCSCGAMWLGGPFGDFERVTLPLSADHLRWWL